ncbi:hypothetical protein KAZ57_01750, partial [Patescibacteria group bacterium]|nr:hypothetical protein [Patescibacteria group bacterium]
MMLKIAYFYPDELNLYGDTGNVEVLQTRASLRGFDTEVLYITSTTQITPALMSGVNLVFMGGGPDSGQKHMYQDLITNKGPFLRDYILQGGVGLYICGSYQLLGNYYKTADATVIEGLGILDFYTQHFGQAKPRCVGNMVCTISSALQQNQLFTAVNTLGTKLVGFENHGGRTYLSPTITPLALVLTGHGNNSEDNTEGLL